MSEFLVTTNNRDTEGTLQDNKQQISEIAKEEFFDCSRGDVEINDKSNICCYFLQKRHSKNKLLCFRGLLMSIFYSHIVPTSRTEELDIRDVTYI